MTWNLRSRNTSKPRSCTRCTTAGPAATKSSLPIFPGHSRGSRRAAKASARSASGKSRGTMMRLLSKLHPREMALGAVELGGAPWRIGLPSTARRALPEELARLEAAVGAKVDRERLGMRMHEVLHELQVLAAFRGRAHQLGVDEPVEPDEGGVAAHLIADQAPRRLVALVLGRRLVDDVQQVKPGAAVLRPRQEGQSRAQPRERLVALEHSLRGEAEIG